MLLLNEKAFHANPEKFVEGGTGGGIRGLLSVILLFEFEFSGGSKQTLPRLPPL